MEYFTIGQYFTKLYIRLLTIILLLIIAFVMVYLSTAYNSQVLPWLTHAQVIAIVAADWLIMFVYYVKKIKSIAKDQGLGLKLTKFFYLTIVRYTILAFGCIFLLLSFYFTKDDVITGIFAANLLLMGLLWPTSPKVCRQLKLRGDEREMVYFKKDQL
jgi:L-asparagine transporter-like permease